MVKIIAEAGVNHNGSLATARKLVIAARSAGADYIKFQTFSTDHLVKKNAKLANYQKDKNSSVESQFELLKGLELSLDNHLELFKLCDESGIKFLSTPFDLPSLELLLKIGCTEIKVSSGDINNFFLLSELAKKNCKIILSTGMATLNEINEACNLLKSNGTCLSNVTILHCTSEYPCPLDNANLLAIPEIRYNFGTAVGFSDHTKEIFTPALAVALGASIIEKHITLDKSMWGPDHKASLEPHEFKRMVDLIRKAERSLGDGIKVPIGEEEQNKLLVRKSLVCSADIKKGDIFTFDNLTAKRPGAGLSPMYARTIIGKKSNRHYVKNEEIKREN
jgi:N,N'-diacetyllegionaminate synthase